MNIQSRLESEKQILHACMKEAVSPIRKVALNRATAPSVSNLSSVRSGKARLVVRDCELMGSGSEYSKNELTKRHSGAMIMTSE